MVSGLPSSIVGFAVVYFTLRLLVRPLNYSFSFRKIAFILTLFVYVSICTLETYGFILLGDYLNAGNITLDTVRISGATVSMNEFNVLFTIVGGIVIMLLDIMIFVFVHRCTRQNPMESAETGSLMEDK